MMEQSDHPSGTDLGDQEGCSAELSLIKERERLLLEASQLHSKLTAPRAPITPLGTHVRPRDEEVKPLSLEKEDVNVEEVAIDEEEEAAIIKRSSLHYFYGTPRFDDDDEGAVNGEAQSSPMTKKTLTVDTTRTTPDGGGSTNNTESPSSGSPKLKKKASFRDDVGGARLGSAGPESPSMRSLTPGKMRPVSREEVRSMLIPPFSPAALSSAGSMRPVSREVRSRGSASGGNSGTPNKQPVSSRMPRLLMEENEGEDSSLGNSLQGRGEESNDQDDDDVSDVSSLNSTDDALIGNLKMELMNTVQVTSPVGDDGLPIDGFLGEGVQQLEVGPHTQQKAGGTGGGDGGDDPEVVDANMPLDLSQFNFATGSYVSNSQSPLKAGTVAVSLAVSPSHDNGFTDAMAVRPRTNERPSSSQQKYLDMYARAQTPIPLDSLEGMELDISGAFGGGKDNDGPASSRSINSQLTMSSMGSLGLKSGIVSTISKPDHVSVMPFPFPKPPGLPHVDSNIKDEKLCYGAIKKPFLTQSDELHNQVREKLMRKQARKRARLAALMELERKRTEREAILLSDFTREQVESAMTYFRTMCAQLSKESIDRAKPGNNNQQDSDTVVSEATKVTKGTAQSNASPQNREGKKKKKNKGNPATDDEIRLNELEAVLRKYRRAKVNFHEEEHGRGLLLSLEWLLEELNLTAMQWFEMVDSQGGTKTGDNKLTYLELSRGVDLLCDELSQKMTAKVKKDFRDAKEARDRARQSRRKGGVMATPTATATSENTSSSDLAANSLPGLDATSLAGLLTGELDGVKKSDGLLAPGTDGKPRNVEVPRWKRQDLHALLKYLDPNGDGDVSVCEMKLAFKNLHLDLESQRVVEGAGPIITRMVEFMQEKQLTVKELFFMIDTDRSLAISTGELFTALNTFFKKPPTEEEEEERRQQEAALAGIDLESSGSLGSDEELTLGGSLGTSMGGETRGTRGTGLGTRGWADYSVSGMSKVSKVPSRFGASVGGSDVSSSWAPRGNLNSRGKHVFLRKSMSSVVLRPIKTRKKSADRLSRTATRDGTADSKKGTGTASGSRVNTTASTKHALPSSASESRLNSAGTPALVALKGGRRGGTFTNLGGQPGGLPGAGDGGGNTLSLLAAANKGAKNGKGARLANAKLMKNHKQILDSYGDLFARQYDIMRPFLSEKKPAKIPE